MTQDPNETVSLTIKVSTLYAIMNVLDVALPDVGEFPEVYEISEATFNAAADGFDDLVDGIEELRGQGCWVTV